MVERLVPVPMAHNAIDRVRHAAGHAMRFLAANAE